MPELAKCEQCVARLASEPHLIGAAASVGIEEGMTTAETVQAYLRGAHDREGHETAEEEDVD